MSRAKILGALARAATDTPAREAAEAAPRSVAERATRSIMPAPQRFFDPSDRAYKPFLRDFEPEAGGRYLEMRRGEAPRDVTGERVEAARIAVGPDGRPSMLVGDPTDLPTGSPGKGSTTTKTNLFKRSAGWDWTEAPEGYADVPTLVSVENRGRHYYALSAEFPKGVDLARYADAPSEPRLRPTTQGNVGLGNRVGTIRVRGKEHPVYDTLTVRSMAPIGGLGAAAAAALEDDEAEGYSAGGKVVSALARALGREAPEAAPAMRGYHGSPHDFAAERLIQRPSGQTEYIVGRPDVLPDVPQGATVLEDFPLGRFRMDKIGTGEGAQAYGHGPYIAEAEDVAQEYRRNLAPLGTRAARHNADAEGMAARLLDSGATPEEAIAELQYRLSLPHVTQGLASGDPVVLEFVEKAKRAQELLRQPNGRMYEVELRTSPDLMLNWDAPLREQSPKIREFFGRRGADENFMSPSGLTQSGGDVYFETAKRNPSGRSGRYHAHPDDVRELSADMAAFGIPGIRYLDQGSRAAGEGTRNFVIFDENLIRIVRKYGIAGLATTLGISEAEAANLAERAGLGEEPAPGFAMGGAVDADDLYNPNFAGNEGMNAMDRSLEGLGEPQRLSTGGRARSGPPPARPPVPPEQLREIFADLERRYDLPEGYLARVRAIESSDGTRLYNRRSGAAGPFQFIPRTARAMGLADPYDEAASAEAAARYAAENARALRRAGVEIDAPTLYLAHQQGATGAVSLLQGNRPATEIVGRNAVLWNGGDPNMTGPQFAGRVFDYFRGQQPAATTVAAAAPAEAAAPAPTPAPAVPTVAPQAPPQPQQQLIPPPPPPAPPVPQRRAEAEDRAIRDVMASLEPQGQGGNPLAPIERHLQMVQAGQRRYATPMPEAEQPVATMAQGGLARALGSMGRGNDTLVAHITPREALMLKAMGGSGTTNPYTGLLEFDDGGGDGNGSDGGGGSDSGGGTGEGAGPGEGPGAGPSAEASQSQAEAEAEAAAAAANVDADAAPGGVNSGFGSPDGMGEGWGDADFGSMMGEAPSVSAPTTETSGRGFGQTGFGTMGSIAGTVAGLATGMPGLGLAGAALGTMADVQALNADLESMGLPGNVSFGPALASNVSFGMLGESPVSQFGNIMGFDALAEAPLSAYSSPVGPPADAPPANGADSDPLPPGVGFNLPEPVTAAPVVLPPSTFTQDPLAYGRAFVSPTGNLSRYGFGGEQSFYRQGFAEGGLARARERPTLRGQLRDIEAEIRGERPASTGVTIARGFGEGLGGIVSPATARAIQMTTRLPQDARFLQAVEATPGARITDDGLMLELLRYQKPEQAGAQAIREGVFYLPATLPTRSVGTYRGPNTAGYGGSEMVRGETLLRAPLAVPGNTGGAVPERAYRELTSDADLQRLLSEARSTANAPLRGGDYYRNVEDFLDRWGGNPDLATELVNASRQGNRMRYALQEHIIGNRARLEGYDSILGTGARKPRISEVFDLREAAYPVPGAPEFEMLLPRFEDALR